MKMSLQVSAVVGLLLDVAYIFPKNEVKFIIVKKKYSKN